MLTNWIPFKNIRRFFSRDSFSVKSLGLSVLMGLFLYSFCADVTMAQDRRTITGTVTDAADGSPLPAVNVLVKGTTIGAATNIDGQYEIQVPADRDTLVFSFIGYLTQQVAIDGRSVVDVAMQSDVQLLEDVVVVGYGVQDKKEITSAVTSVKAEDFNKGSINDASELLQGKVSGLTISSTNSGDPNAGFNLRVRGISSVGANLEPLVVIDGIVGGSLNNVDPSDIASIDVLKDASAAAIYGTRGSGGVIIVTTKSGQGGTGDNVTVSYNGYITLRGIENQLDVLDADEFRQLSSDAGVSINDGGADTDWFDEITQTGIDNVHNLALSGGTSETNYRVSVNFRDVEGIQQKTGFQQQNARLNLTHFALDRKLKFTGVLGATSRESDFGFGEVFRYAATANPTLPVTGGSNSEINAGFTELDIFDWFNPVSINEQTVNTGEQKNISASIKADYDFGDIIQGLGASVSYSFESVNILNGQAFAKTAEFRGLGRNGLANRFTSDQREELFEITSTYANNFDRLDLNVVAGYSWQDFDTEQFFIEGGDFLTDITGFNDIEQSFDFENGLGVATSQLETNRLIAGFIRTNLVFDNTYFASFTYRREGSSRFGENEKWGDFGAASLGAELTEIFVLPEEINQLKLRVSAGLTGAQPAQNGLSQFRLAASSNFFDGSNFVPSFAPASNPNPDLKWEEKTEINVGADFELFESRLTGSIDWYTNTTDDLILSAEVPSPPNLFSTTVLNAGELENTGLDIALGYLAVQNTDLTWSTDLTFSTFSSELVDFTVEESLISNAGAPGLNDTPLIRIREGSSIGQIWGPVLEEIDENGNFVFADLNGDGVADPNDNADKTVIGNGLPDFQLGWNNTVNYKSWDLNLFFEGVFGHDKVNTFRLFYETPNQISSYNVLASTPSNLNEDPVFSDFYVEDASFVRLNNATLGYTIPLANESAIRNLRLYFSVNNVFTITGYDGISPDVSFADVGPVDNGGVPGEPNPLAPGIERRNQWFTTRSFTFGVNLDF